jgi:hypothetical protein
MKYLLIIFFLLICIISFGQVPIEDTNRYQKYPTANGPQYTQGWFTKLLRLPDTASMQPAANVPGAIGRNAAGNKAFLWDGSAWVEVSGGGATTWEQTLINQGATPFTQDNTVNFDRHSLILNNLSAILAAAVNDTLQSTLILEPTEGASLQSSVPGGRAAIVGALLTSANLIVDNGGTKTTQFSVTDSTFSFSANDSSNINIRAKVDSSEANPDNVAWFDANNILRRGHITAGGSSDTSFAKLHAQYGIHINNEDSTYDPKGLDVSISADTTAIRNFVTQVIEGDTTINNFDSTDITFAVDSIVFAPPPGAIDGNIYLIGVPATGLFAGKENQIAERVGGAWSYTIANSGDIIAVTNPVTAFYKYSGLAWVFLRRVPSIGGDALGVNEDLGNLSNNSLSLITGTSGTRRLTITAQGKLRVRDFWGADISKNYLKVVDSTNGELGLANFKQLVAGTGITITSSPAADTISSSGGGGGAGTITGSGLYPRMAFWRSPTAISSGANINIDSTNTRIGFGTAAPTHTITLDSTRSKSGITWYNSVDQTTNYQRARIYTDASHNLWIQANEAAGTGVCCKSIFLNHSSASVTYNGAMNNSQMTSTGAVQGNTLIATNQVQLDNSSVRTANGAMKIGNFSTYNASSGQATGMSMPSAPKHLTTPLQLQTRL